MTQTTVMNTHEDSLQRQQTKDNSHEVGGADRVLDVKELTIWEAVALRFSFE